MNADNLNYTEEHYSYAKLLANVVAALLAMILSIRFTPAYYTYAIILFVIYFVYDCTRSKACIISMPSKAFTIGYCLLYGSLIVSAGVNADKDGLSLVRQYIYWSLPMWMIAYMAGKYNIEKGFLTGILSGAIISGIYGAAQWMKHPGERIFSFYTYPTHYGLVIAIVLPVVAYLIFKRKESIAMRLIALATALFMLVLLFLTDTRAALIAICIGFVGSIGIVLVRHWQQIDRKIKIGTLIFVLALAFSGVAGFNYMQGHRTSYVGQIGGERLLMLSASYKMWEDHKISGIGLDSWEKYYYSKEYHPEEGTETNLDMPHNMFVYFLSCAGIIGAVGFVLYTVLTFWGLLRVPFGKNLAMEICSMAVFIAFFIDGMADSTLINKIPVKIYFALMGFFMMYNHGAKGKVSDENQ
ncbi:O-antigen ligase [uncultured Dialister sp.]|jgi:O-antigen ligase|uniref:O-antigen ligase family protein n=1 Tax=uncultured Dialister sp. TaxID=278064 RepID=UPI0025F1FA51|nr:O-antigen ligase family protein [uncultured Dialister sp.]